MAEFDGKMFQELGTVFRRLGERPSDKELKDMVDEVDEDKNGTIEFEEFLNMMAMRLRNIVNSEYRILSLQSELLIPMSKNRKVEKLQICFSFYRYASKGF